MIGTSLQQEMVEMQWWKKKSEEGGNGNSMQSHKKLEGP